jgi:branched-chain amino acid transport system ATP-binding protein
LTEVPVALLEIRNLSQHFGGVAALNQLDLKVSDLEILGLIGPNGAGKTTLFNVISGFYAPSTGTVAFKGETVSGLRPDQIARKGIGRTFQQTVLFMRSTVFQNVVTGFHMNFTSGLLNQFLHARSAAAEESDVRKKAAEILEFMGLNALKDELAQNLPHGHQRTLGICVALAASPRLLLLDEPLTGMNPTETLTTLNHIRQLKERGITIIIVEHNMKAVMSLCERLVVLNHGEKIAEGNCEEIQANKAVIEAYLGKERG